MEQTCSQQGCGHSLCPSDTKRLDLCRSHGLTLCEKHGCFELKSSCYSQYCVTHHRRCIQCAIPECHIWFNRTGRCLDCYSECRLQEIKLHFECNLCHGCNVGLHPHKFVAFCEDCVKNGGSEATSVSTGVRSRAICSEPVCLFDFREGTDTFSTNVPTVGRLSYLVD